MPKKPGMNIAIIGSRSFNNFSYAINKIKENIDLSEVSTIISGGAKGSDQLAEKLAERYNIPIKIFKPDWSIGKHAGMLRNTEIINKANHIIAFWDGKSKGTLDSINKAKKLGKKLSVIRIEPNTMNDKISYDDYNFIIHLPHEETPSELILIYNKDYVTEDQTNKIKQVYSFKPDRQIDKKERLKIRNYFNTELKIKLPEKYQDFLNKSIPVLFNNPYIEIKDVDMVYIPQTCSGLNTDITKIIHDKIPNAILNIETLVNENISDKIERNRLQKLYNGKMLIVNDFVCDEMSAHEINKIIKKYKLKEVIYYSLIAK